MPEFLRNDPEESARVIRIPAYNGATAVWAFSAGPVPKCPGYCLPFLRESQIIFQQKKERKKERTKEKEIKLFKIPPPKKKFKEEEEKRKKRIIISLLPKIGQKCNKIGANAGPVRLDPCQIPNGTFLARDPSQILARLQRVDGQLQPPDNWHPAKSCRFPDSFDFSLSGMLEASWKILPASFFEFPCPFE